MKGVERNYCQEVPYIDETIRDVMKVKEDEIDELVKAFKWAKTIIPVSEGRSWAAAQIGLQGTEKRVRTLTDIDFPGRNIVEAAPKLEESDEKILILVNSGSGETTTPKEIVTQIVDEYIKKTQSEAFQIILITSRLVSSIAKKIKDKDYAKIVFLKGPKEKAKNAKEAKERGIMDDVFELGGTLLMNDAKEAVNFNHSAGWVKEEVRKDGLIIGKLVYEGVRSKEYRELVEKMTSRIRVTIGGRGPGEKVALMSAIRLKHVKSSIGDDAYLDGAFAPKPRPGDLLILISWSGENPPLEDWIKEFKQVQGYTFVLTAHENSVLAQKSDSHYILRASPRKFYLYAAYWLSYQPVLLILRLESLGFNVTPEILEWAHSRTQ